MMRAVRFQKVSDVRFARHRVSRTNTSKEAAMISSPPTAKRLTPCLELKGMTQRSSSERSKSPPTYRVRTGLNTQSPISSWLYGCLVYSGSGHIVIKISSSMN